MAGAEDASTPSTTHPAPATARIRDEEAEEAFTSLYLRQITSEFSDDLDRIRSAGDFNGAASLGTLVDALKQGRACFGKEERVGIGRGVMEAAGTSVG